jgi:hypothetical protein
MSGDLTMLGKPCFLKVVSSEMDMAESIGI